MMMRNLVIIVAGKPGSFITEKIEARAMKQPNVKHDWYSEINILKQRPLLFEVDAT